MYFHICFQTTKHMFSNTCTKHLLIGNSRALLTMVAGGSNALELHNKLFINLCNYQ